MAGEIVGTGSVGIYKKAEAFDIIKKHIRLDKYHYVSDETYDATEYMFFITKEEFELLKEALND